MGGGIGCLAVILYQMLKIYHFPFRFIANLIPTTYKYLCQLITKGKGKGAGIAQSV
jgi:hypothetical protein